MCFGTAGARAPAARRRRHSYSDETPTAREALLRENVAADSVHVTGNTVIDALHSGGYTHVDHIDMPVSPHRVWKAMQG